MLPQIEYDMNSLIEELCSAYDRRDDQRVREIVAEMEILVDIPAGGEVRE